MSIDVILKDRSGTDITYDASGGVSLLTTQNTQQIFYPGSDDPGYITFSSPGAFTLKIKRSLVYPDQEKLWAGTVQWSKDLETWTDVLTTTLINSGADNKIYVRGYGNSFLASDYNHQNSSLFELTGSDISVSGNIASLLDADAVKHGLLPQLGPYAFYSLFAGNASLSSIENLILPYSDLVYNCYARMFENCVGITSTPELPITSPAGFSCFRMFAGCTALTHTPDILPAEKTYTQCYGSMFSGCTSLTSVPKLPATSLGGTCYYLMFDGCTSLTTISTLPGTTIPVNAYYGMFRNCSSLKLSATQTGIYQYPFRMPTSGTGSAQSNSFTNMFTGTGGTFTGTPSVNTTYYTDHEPV